VTAVPGRSEAEPPRIDGADRITRYLCAGAYLDPQFAQAVLDEVVADPHRAIAPAPGTDVEAVARHSVAALHRSVRRDVLLSVILLAVAVAAGLRGALVVLWACSTVLLVRSLRDLARSDLAAALSRIVIFLLISAVCVIGLLFLAARDRSGLPGEGGSPLPVGFGTLLVLAILALWMVVFLDRVAVHGVTSETLAPGRFVAPGADFPATGTAQRDRLRYVGRARNSALTVYSASAPGGPFVGFGAVVHAWTASCRLRPARAGTEPDQLRVPDVYDAVRRAFATLGSSGAALGPSGAAPGEGRAGTGEGPVDVTDRVVAPGWLPSSHPFVENPPLRPVAAVPPAVVADIAAGPSGAETYYLTVHIPSPTGERSVTGHVHVDLSGDLLSVDVALTALPPVDSRYRAIDNRPPAGGILLARLLGEAAVGVIRLSPRAPVNLVRAGRRAVVQRAGVLSQPTTAGPRDLGARSGVRELGSPDAGLRPAQDFELTRAANLISRTLVETVTGLMEAHGLDGSDFARTAEPVWHKSLDRSAASL
jgi:hypothetical protein